MVREARGEQAEMACRSASIYAVRASIYAYVASVDADVASIFAGGASTYDDDSAYIHAGSLPIIMAALLFVLSVHPFSAVLVTCSAAAGRRLEEK
eukprot:73604-Rhodomonas_salina.1